MHDALSKEFLEGAYIQDGLSTWAIEKKYGYSRSSVYSALKKFNIPIRNIAQAHIKYTRTDFSGNQEEKAYMLGFAIGDLRVRNHNKDKSETISIACGSTKKAQIDLIENMFSKYGRVWIGKSNAIGVINVEAYVNHSFSFLLPKIRKYKWCEKNKKYFYAFLAGFTDAEGSFFISNGKAFVAWGNYDLDILKFISKSLIRFGHVVPKIHCDKLKGKINSHGYTRNGTYCHISFCKKDEISKLLKKLRPYLRHRDKLRKLVVIEENINLRNKANV